VKRLEADATAQVKGIEKSVAAKKREARPGAAARCLHPAARAGALAHISAHGPAGAGHAAGARDQGQAGGLSAAGRAASHIRVHAPCGLAAGMPVRLAQYV
jgi:hypothetical protein